MTTRIGSPDTQADIQLRICLDEQPKHHFIMVAGAGSGKTTSLIKALSHLEKTKGKVLRSEGQRIACITYTEVAVEEIWGDVGNAPIFHVSTIHSFLWTLIHPFHADIKSWVVGRINEKIIEAETRLANPRTRAATRPVLTADITRYRTQLTELANVTKFTYGTGSNYSEGILGHDDILRIGPALIENSALMKSLVANRFPYIFVDESQDTNPDVVHAFKEIAKTSGLDFCLGFFGDPMQKIYATGIGKIPEEPGWVVIKKPENFRCPPSVLSVINKIRAEDDGLVQTIGHRQGLPQGEAIQEGKAKIFIAPNAGNRAEKLALVRTEMAAVSNDPLWTNDEEEGDVRLLVLVHRVAANRLGFPSLYAALNDNGSTALKDGLTDGTAWVLKPFLDFVLPLALSARNSQHFEVISILRKLCPQLSQSRLIGQDIAALLARLSENVDELQVILGENSNKTIRDLLTFLRGNEMCELDPRILLHLDGNVLGREPSETASVNAFLLARCTELWGYHKYVTMQSPFATQQGIKGAQFQRVLAVLDDEESDYNLFSYDKYFGITPLSDTDQDNISEGKDSVLDRTRRLIYVCCSRAVKDLAVVLFATDTATSRNAVLSKGLFRAEDVVVLA